MRPLLTTHVHHHRHRHQLAEGGAPLAVVSKLQTLRRFGAGEGPAAPSSSIPAAPSA